MQEIQRARIIAAMASAVYQRGAVNVSVADVTAHAGVSRRTFYEAFANGEQCLLATLEDAFEQTRRTVLEASESAGDTWRERMRAGMCALLTCFERRPEIAYLLVVEWFAAGPAALALRERAIAQLAAALEAGREQRTLRSELPQLTSEALIGACVAVLHRRLLEDRRTRGKARSPRLAELTGPLMSMIVLPYLGAAAAGRELAQPLPDASSADDGASLPAPLQLEMRLTYRTIAVLKAIAADPGASNRAIAEAAGVADQGQISKLLARLQSLGLLRNAHANAGANGKPNSWTLTAKGRKLERSLQL